MKRNDVEKLIELVRRGGADAHTQVKDPAHAELAALMAALRNKYRSEDDASILAHPHAEYIEFVARHGANALPDNLAWIREHVGDCELCTQAVQIARATLDDVPSSASDEARDKKPGLLARIWDALTRTALQPAFAGAYLLALAGIGTWLLLGPAGSDHTAVLVPVPQVVFSDPLLRSAPHNASVLMLSPTVLEQPYLHLVLQTDRDGLDDPSRRYEVVIQTDEGDALWRENVSGARVSSLGVVSVLIPTRGLSREKTYLVRLIESHQTAALLERRIGFQR